MSGSRVSYTCQPINSSSYIIPSSFFYYFFYFLFFYCHGHWEDISIQVPSLMNSLLLTSVMGEQRDLSHKLSTTFLHLNVFCPDGSTEINEVPLCWMQWNLKKSLRHRFQGQWCCYSLLAMFETTQNTGTETPYTYRSYRFVCHLSISCLNFLIVGIWIAEINLLIAATDISLVFHSVWSGNWLKTDKIRVFLKTVCERGEISFIFL